MYVGIYIYMYVYIYIYICICVYAYVCIYTYVYVRIFKYICIDTDAATYVVMLQCKVLNISRKGAMSCWFCPVARNEHKAKSQILAATPHALSVQLMAFN